MEMWDGLENVGWFASSEASYFRRRAIRPSTPVESSTNVAGSSPVESNVRTSEP